MSGRLVLCGTPIGNLGDATLRLASVLAEADVVFAEDTRRTATLLNHLGVERPMRSYFAGNEAQRAGELRARLEAGETVALVTDAGMPCYGAVDCTPVEVIDTYLADNGDHDGWADTDETVEMRFTVVNRSTRDVTGLVARLSAARGAAVALRGGPAGRLVGEEACPNGLLRPAADFCTFVAGTGAQRGAGRHPH